MTASVVLAETVREGVSNGSPLAARGRRYQPGKGDGKRTDPVQRSDQQPGGPAASAGGQGGPPEVPGSHVTQAEEGPPDWVYPIPDEEVLFGPDARQTPALPNRPDSEHYYIHVGDRMYFLKPSGVVSGQAASELITNALGLAAGLLHWPRMRVFANPDNAEVARVVLSVVPGILLADAIKELVSIDLVLLRFDAQSVADTLVLEMATLAGDRHDENYMVSGNQLIGIDYQMSFDQEWPGRFGVVARNLPEGLPETPLRRVFLSARLEQTEEVLRRVQNELIPNLDSGSTATQVVEAVEERFAILEELLQLEHPTLGDLIELHPDRQQP
jgi:hypothetical protein